MLQHHVHEARAPQAAAAGGIAADVAPRLGDDIGRAETGARRHAGLGHPRVGLFASGGQAPCPREVTSMAMAAVMFVMMVMMRENMPPCAVMMRPCRSRRRRCDED